MAQYGGTPAPSQSRPWGRYVLPALITVALLLLLAYCVAGEYGATTGGGPGPTPSPTVSDYTAGPTTATESPTTTTESPTITTESPTITAPPGPTPTGAPDTGGGSTAGRDGDRWLASGVVLLLVSAAIAIVASGRGRRQPGR